MKLCKYVFITLLIPFATLCAQQATWELVRENFWGKIAVDPTNSDIIYVSPGNNEQYGLHKSVDGGKTWVYYDIEYGPEDGGIVIDPANSQRLWIYGGPFKGLVRSEDGGVTAVRADTGISFDHHGYSVRALAYDHIRDILYAGDNSLIPGGIYRSYDLGRRWQLVHAYGSGLVFDPTFFLVEEDSGWIYSGTSAQGIRRSNDFGVTWTLLHPEVLAGHPIAFLAKTPNSRTLYAIGGRGEMFKSYDLGEKWFSIAATVTDSSQLVGGLLVSLLDTNYVYVGSWGGSNDRKGGFFLSRNGGSTWQLYHVGLSQYDLRGFHVLSIAEAPISHDLYMSTRFSLREQDEIKTYRLSEKLLTSIQEYPHSSPPVDFILKQNHPNPFSANTKIEFSVPRRVFVALDVYDLNGEIVASLINGQIEEGVHSVSWNGKNPKGGKVSNGIYFIRLQVGHDVSIRKMLLTR